MANFNPPPPVTGNPDMDAYLRMQQLQHQQGASEGAVPSGVAPNPTAPPPTESTPSFDVNALMAPFQAQAEQLYGGNPVFGHSAFATNHPRLANVLAGGLTSLSKWHTGPTTGDNIGNAAQMALAPEELARQRAIQKAQYPAAMIGPQMEMAEKGAQINRDNAYAEYMKGANTNRAQGQANLSNARTTSEPIKTAQGQEKIEQKTAEDMQHAKDFTSTLAFKTWAQNQKAKIAADKQHDPTGNATLNDKTQLYKTWQTQSDVINHQFNQQILDLKIKGKMGPGGLMEPATQADIDTVEAQRQEALNKHDIEGRASVKEVFGSEYEDMFDMRDGIQKEIQDRQTKAAQANAPKGMIFAQDPNGVLHQAPAGTKLPPGWKLKTHK